MNQSDEFEITIEVCDPKIVPGINKYVTYTIRGMDKNGQFDVIRRFSDFNTIRLLLVQKWPGCFIPPIPPRKAFGNMEQQFIEERMKMLSDFLRKISTIKYLWYSEEFQVFLKNTGDLEKSLLLVPKITNEEIIKKYEETFSYLSGKEINRDVIQKINDFYAFIRKVQPMVNNFKQIAKNIADASSTHQQTLIHLITQFIPQYENLIVKEYSDSEDNLIFANFVQDEEISQLVNSYCELLKEQRFQDLYQEVRKEGKQLKAFIQTFQEREKYELQKINAEAKQKDLELELQEVLAGKTTLKTLFQKSKKEEIIAKLQQQIKSIEDEIQNYQFICDILTVLVGYIEIDKFKEEKQIQYYSLIKGIIEYQVRLCTITEQFWTKVLENKNLSSQQC